MTYLGYLLVIARLSYTLPFAYYFFLLRGKNYISLQQRFSHSIFLVGSRVLQDNIFVRLKSVAYFAALAVKLKATHVARLHEINLMHAAWLSVSMQFLLPTVFALVLSVGSGAHCDILDGSSI